MRCDNELGADLPSGGPSETVHNLNELEDVINRAKEHWHQSGGTIILAGTINMNSDKSFKDLRPEKIEHPVVIRPQSIGGATIKGDGELRFQDVRNVWLYGVNFEYDPEGGDSIVTFEKAAKCRIARCDFHTKYDDNEALEKEAGKHYYLTISSGRKDDEGKNLIDHNIFHHKPKSEGAFLRIGNRVSKDNIIEFNYFLEKPWRNGENSEALRIGESEVGERSFSAIVRYNLFEKCNADVECITNKSRDNTYSNNTFLDNIGSLTFRHGWNITADSNIFMNCARGIRIFGKDNEIRNNYFKNVPPKNLTEYFGNVPSNQVNEGDSDIAAIVVGEGGGGYLQVEICNIEGNLIEKIDGKAKRFVTWRGTGDGRPRDVDFIKNKIIVRGGTIFSERPDLTNDDDFRDNKIFHIEDIDVNLPNSAHNSQKVDSLELLDIIRPNPLQSIDVGPCSGLSDYTFSLVRETLGD